jgi:hypothetical protein
MNSKQLEAEEFLKTLYSRYFQNNKGNIELRLIGDHGANSRFFRKCEIGEAEWTAIAQANAGSHVYFGVNPRPLSQAKKQEDILDVVCLWADIDGKDFEGGKEEALKAAEAFSITPTIIVDSGHGYHLYWVLSEPIIDLKDEARAEFKRILSGVFGEIGADGSKIHLDSCLRLPGTLNIKNGDPTECKLVEFKPEQTYRLEDFAKFKNADYQEVQEAEGPLPEFGTKTLVISIKDAEAAKADVEKLTVPSKTKNLIISGALLRKKDAKNSRSERDFSIICSLIIWDYDYATIKNIFFNPFLKCSNRIREKGETTLLQDVRKALKDTKQGQTRVTPQSLEIERIKNNEHLTADQKRKAIEAVVINDLLTGPIAAGYGFREPVFENYYFFDKAEKTLMKLESMNFYCYIRARFGVSKNDFEEIKDGVRTAIYSTNKMATPHRFAYYDPKKFVLYVSNHDNGIYRLDGEKVELHDNGVDGIYFEYDHSLTPFTYDPQLDVVDYFPTRTKSGDSIDVALYDLESIRSRFPGGSRPGFSIRKRDLKINIPPLERSGFSLERFSQSNCLLKQFLVDRASFIEDEDDPMSTDRQRLFLVLYFYSTFFESLMKEKPIACFVGLKASGKSFIATSIGKIFFGDSFESSGLPKSADDLAVVLGKNHYLVLDNLDTYLRGEMLDMLCSVATGVEIKKRQLYTDDTEIKFVPHCFPAITSREPKFKRDDLVDRLLLFYTKRIKGPVSRSELTRSLLEKRSAIMTEVLTNLNSIVKILALEEVRKLKDPDWRPLKCISRLGDWETFGRTVCGFNSGFYFIFAMQAMNEDKDDFSIGEDYLFLTIANVCYIRETEIKDTTTAQLYALLAMEAEEMGLNDFPKHYKSSMSIGKKFPHIMNSLEKWFEIKVFDLPNCQRLFSFKAIWGDTKKTKTGVDAAKEVAAWERGKKSGSKQKKESLIYDEEPVDNKGDPEGDLG